MRVPHILKPNKNNETVHEAIWFDTETKPEILPDKSMVHHLWFGWACYRRRIANGKWGKENWFRFTTRDDLWTWVFEHTRNKVKLWLFCHNAAFDLPVLDSFKQMSDAGFKLKSATLESPPTVLKYRRENTSVTIVDTLNIWRMPLASIGKQIGIPKLEMPDRDAPQLAWDTYGQQDVRVIMNACLLWWQMLIDLDMGGFAPTLAAQSMTVFRHKYMRHEIFIDVNEDALELSRSGYHGGRTEAFFIGRNSGEFYLVDVNSMYPAVMAETFVPIRIIGYTRRATVDDLQRWTTDSCVVASVQIRTGENFAPMRRDGKLLFPSGKFDCVLSTPEIVYGLEHCTILRIYECAVYERAIAFYDYMTDVWQRRSKALEVGDTVLATQLKTLVNAFYGKWGQSGRVWMKIADAPTQAISFEYELDMVTRKLRKIREFGGIRQIQSDDFESSNSFPAIAAHITAAGRMRLYALMCKAGMDNVFYCDTDSLLVNKAGFEQLQECINPAVLGMLKLEGVFDHIRIWGPKDYIFGTKVKQKGIRKNAILVGENTYDQERWLSLKGLIREGTLDKAITQRVRKTLRRTYDKGIILENGRVVPIHYFG